MRTNKQVEEFAAKVATKKDHTIAKRVFSVRSGKRYYIAFFEFHSLMGQRPYFSITGEEGRIGAKDCESCGCMHEMIAEKFPHLHRFIPMHLSNGDGVPTHAVENGWYWAGGTEWKQRQSWEPEIPNVKILADSLRISEDLAAYIIAAVGTQPKELSPRSQVRYTRMNGFPQHGISKQEFAVIVDTFRDRWKTEAEEAFRYLMPTHP